MMTRLSPVVMLLMAFGATASAGPDDRKAAAALFDKGIRDVQAGNIERGCNELAESVAMWPDSGAKGALAECDTTLGRLGEAWELWRDLATSAPTAELRDDAARNARALDRRLVRLALRIRGASPATLVVTVNGKPVSTLEDTERRAEPGKLVVVATSTETLPWTQTFQAEAGAKLAIDIQLQPLAVSQRRNARLIGLTSLAVGVAGLGVGAVFGGMAYADWQNARDACGGNTDHCKSAGFASAQQSLEDARRSARISTIATTAGAGLTALGLVFYIYSARTPRAETTAWRVSPLAGPDTMGVVLSRSLP